MPARNKQPSRATRTSRARDVMISTTSAGGGVGGPQRPARRRASGVMGGGQRDELIRLERLRPRATRRLVHLPVRPLAWGAAVPHGATAGAGVPLRGVCRVLFGHRALGVGARVAVHSRASIHERRDINTKEEEVQDDSSASVRLWLCTARGGGRSTSWASLCPRAVQPAPGERLPPAPACVRLSERRGGPLTAGPSRNCGVPI